MPIQSSTAVNIPAAATDSLAVGMFIQPRFTPAGVGASLVLQVQRYRQASGAAPVKIGDPQTINVPDVFAAAAKDAAFATMVMQMEGLIQTYVAGKGL